MYAERSPARAAPFVIALVTALTSAGALADAPAPARDPAAAEALYRSARELLAKGDWAAACPKFTASFDLDPAASTQINIAKCIEHDGKLALAWVAYKRALVLNQETPGAERQRALADVANKAIAALEPRLPQLRVSVSPQPADLQITRDGQKLPAATLGEALPIDPGEHEIVASAPGFAEARQRVVAEESKTAEVALTLVPQAPPAATAPTELTAPPVATAPTELANKPYAPPPALPDPDNEPPRSGKIPLASWIGGGVGFALIAAGAGLRADGAAAEANLDANCGPERRCDPAKGYDPADDNARKNRDFGLFVGLTVVGGAGVAAAVIGAVVSVTKGGAPTSAKTARVRLAPWASPSGGGAVLRGTFE